MLSNLGHSLLSCIYPALIVIAVDGWRLPQSYIHHTRFPSSPILSLVLDSDIRCESVRPYSHPLQHMYNITYNCTLCKMLTTYRLFSNDNITACRSKFQLWQKVAGHWLSANFPTTFQMWLELDVFTYSIQVLWYRGNIYLNYSS